MTKIFLSIFVKRKMYVEFGIQKPISMAVNEQQTEGPSKATEKKIQGRTATAVKEMQAIRQRVSSAREGNSEYHAMK